jgi:hypothetical protein
MRLISWSYYAAGSHLARYKARAEPFPHEKQKVMNPMLGHFLAVLSGLQSNAAGRDLAAGTLRFRTLGTLASARRRCTKGVEYSWRVHRFRRILTLNESQKFFMPRLRFIKKRRRDLLV